MMVVQLRRCGISHATDLVDADSGPGVPWKHWPEESMESVLTLFPRKQGTTSSVGSRIYNLWKVPWIFYSPLVPHMRRSLRSRGILLPDANRRYVR